MATRPLIRWSGMALLLAGVISLLAEIMHPNIYALNAVLDARWVPAHIGEALASLLMVLGLVGLYLRQAERTGTLGLIGFIVAFFGSAALVGVALWLEVFLFPYLAAHQVAAKTALDVIDPAGPLAATLIISTLSSTASGLGWILMGIATIRAGVLPRSAGWLLIIGVALASASFLSPALWFLLNLGGVVFGLGVAWLGYALWSDTGTLAARREEQPEGA